MLPKPYEGNKYISQIKDAIKLAGYNVIHDDNGNCRLINFLKSDIFQLNWFESVNGLKGYVKKKIILKIIKLTGKKIITTFHNKITHTPENRTKYFYSIFKYLLEISDGIIIHSNYSYKFIHNIAPMIDENKIFYVPHPNYINVYPDSIKYSGYLKKSDELTLLFIGSLSSYKNPEVVIKLANSLKNISGIHFLICGDGGEERKNYLRSLIDPDNKNITADFRFIECGEIPSLLKISDVVLLPYNPVSMLNSGATHLAFSFGKTVITNDEVGTIKDLPDKNLVYTYKYENNINSHVEILKKIVLSIKDEFINQRETFLSKGNTLKNLELKNNSIEATAEALSKIYESLY